MFGGVMFVWRVNPQLLNHRGEWKKKEGNKRWDKLLLILYGVSGFYIVPAVIGLDVRFQWSYLGIGFAVGGAVLFIVGSVLIHWAMMVNTHFEVTVRVQKDRNHKVITAGPYEIVRHPGYVGVILWLVSFPLMIGSVVGLIPAGFAVLLITIRTLLEDRMLCSELDGYSEYAARVRYRLVPAIW
jgi:protein-S-isoprenylcysteine O-methyltransferase Ste14